MYNIFTEKGNYKIRYNICYSIGRKVNKQVIKRTSHIILRHDCRTLTHDFSCTIDKNRIKYQM